jgi:hypothetical protein
MIKKAKLVGIETIAYSPDENKDSHNKRIYNLATHHFNEIKYHNGFTIRSLAMFNEADSILVLNGRMGTLSEFTIALEEGKRIGVITNTGGIADHLKKIMILANKDFPDQLFFSRNPAKVIDWVAKK